MTKSNSAPSKLKGVPPSLVERLSFIEARLFFLGELRRTDGRAKELAEHLRRERIGF